MDYNLQKNQNAEQLYNYGSIAVRRFRWQNGRRECSAPFPYPENGRCGKSDAP